MDLADNLTMSPLHVAALLVCCALSDVPARARAGDLAATDASALLRAIEREIGDAACDADARCHTIPVGAKACGGPEAYLAWSDKVSRAAPLAELAARHRAAREAENARNRVISNCAVMTDPGAVCRPRAGDGARVCQRGAGAMAGER